MDIKRISLPPQPYLYIEQTVPMTEMGQAMGQSIPTLFGFIGQNGITPASMPLSIYPDMPGERVTFRTAVFVSEEDAKKASGEVKADVMPAGEAMTATHVGGYDKLGQTHQAIWSQMAAEGLTGGAMWEIYVDDPQQTGFDKAKTEAYRAIL